ncbi:hypothetical protein EZS27_008812 [termite gut metagenome]|uniref:Type I restriction modification DNA specificity domain-containing protein n=1 Tax=termite gut metagenome TaxID=433724 RepID=A0A5J4SE00_9ZZZZ
MRVTNIKSQEIYSSMRIDGSYHLSHAVIFERSIEEREYVPLYHLTDRIFTAGRSKRMYTQKERGLPYLSNSDVIAQNPFQNCKYNSKKYGYDENAFIKEGMILTGRVGAIAQTAYATREFEEKQAMGSDNIIRIVTKCSKGSGFLYAFLNSKIGRTLLWKLATGGVQPYITEDMIASIPVPIFSSHKQEEIHNLIVEAAELRVEANQLLEEAERNLVEKLKITIEDNNLFASSEKKTKNIYSLQRNDLSTLTFRGRNYSPRKQNILAKLKSNSYDRLIDVLERPPFYGSRFKRIEASKGNIELLSQGDIFDYKPKGRMISSRNIANLNEEIVKKGTILIPAQGTLGENEIFGHAKFVWGYLENKLIAGHAMRFIPNTALIREGYLFAVLSSNMWFRLLRNSVYGTNLLGFIIPMINEYPIPRFEKEFEEEIDASVKNAYEKHTTAIDKEYQAIQLIEKEIESWQQS